MKKCLQKDKSQRPTAEALLQDEWLQSDLQNREASYQVRRSTIMRTVSDVERFLEMNEFQQAVCSYICTIQVKSNQLKSIA